MDSPLALVVLLNFPSGCVHILSLGGRAYLMKTPRVSDFRLGSSALYNFKLFTGALVDSSTSLSCDGHGYLYHTIDQSDALQLALAGLPLGGQ